MKKESGGFYRNLPDCILVRLPESHSAMAHLSQRPNVPRLSLRRTLVRQYGSRRALEQLNVANFRAAWALDWGT